MRGSRGLPGLMFFFEFFPPEFPEKSTHRLGSFRGFFSAFVSASLGKHRTIIDLKEPSAALELKTRGAQPLVAVFLFSLVLAGRQVTTFLSFSLSLTRVCENINHERVRRPR